MDLMTIDEVAEELRTKPATLRYWRHIGQGPKAFRIGKRLAYKRTDVAEWVEQQYNAEVV